MKKTLEEKHVAWLKAMQTLQEIGRVGLESIEGLFQNPLLRSVKIGNSVAIVNAMPTDMVTQGTMRARMNAQARALTIERNTGSASTPKWEWVDTRPLSEFKKVKVATRENDSWPYMPTFDLILTS